MRVDGQTVIDLLLNDKPMFHDDADGRPVSWNTNTQLLRFLEEMIKPGMHTLETGAGYSTVIFIGKKCRHTAVSPSALEFERIARYCNERDLTIENVEFVKIDSTAYLPLLKQRDLDVLFIDGAHRFPFPMVDWFYGTQALGPNGIVIVDDTDIISCNILCKFMESDSHWEKVAVSENYGIFRKLGDHNYPGDWPGQNFSMNKVSDSVWPTR